MLVEGFTTTTTKSLPTSLGHIDMLTAAPLRLCTNLDAHRSPDIIMAMTRANQSMGDFVKNGVLDIHNVITMNVIHTEGDSLPTMLAQTCTTFGPIILEGPVAKAMLIHEFTGDRSDFVSVHALLRTAKLFGHFMPLEFLLQFN